MMLRNLLYVASKEQLRDARTSFERLSKGSDKNIKTDDSEIYFIEHHTLTSFEALCACPN